MATPLKQNEECDEAITLKDIPGVDLLTPEEGRAFFDRRARELLGISGEEFLRRWDAVRLVPFLTLRSDAGWGNLS